MKYRGASTVIMRHMECAMALLLITELRERRQQIHISLIPPFRPAMNEMQLRTGNELIHGAYNYNGATHSQYLNA